MAQAAREAVPVDATIGVERPPLIGDMVLDRIRAAIIERRLPPGARLSEASLAKMLGVSKTPVREALLRLRMTGLVTAHGNSLRVVLPSPQLVREAYEVRSGLEALTAQLAAERATPDDVRSISEAAALSMEAATQNDLAGFRKHDGEFHRRVSVASQNASLVQKVRDATDLCQALRQRDVISDHVSRICGQAHLAIAEAIAGRDGDSARLLMMDHVQYVMRRVVGASLPQSGEDAGTASDAGNKAPVHAD